jgi:uncharacterized protein (DUF2342 family)
MDGLNRVWTAPEALPAPGELRHPDRWLERIRTKRLEPTL